MYSIPQIHTTCFTADNASIIGNVELAENVNVSTDGDLAIANIVEDIFRETSLVLSVEVIFCYFWYFR